jgi:multicomponent Na+:H+ antiporter subunit D
MVNTPLLFMATPIIFAVISTLAEKYKIHNLREGTALLSSLAIIYGAYNIHVTLSSAPDNILLLYIGVQPPLGACLQIDLFSSYLALSVAGLGLLVTFYSLKYMEHDTRLTEYYTLLNLLLVSMIGVTFSGDFVTLFIFWELMAITSYTLVAFRKNQWESIEAGFKFMVMGALGSTVLLMGIALVYGAAGTVNFAQISLQLTNKDLGLWGPLILTLFVIGFGVKAAVAPFHTWLPDAHSAAPSSISALLSGVVVKMGVYSLLRIISLVYGASVANWQIMLASLAVATMFTGNIMALLQTDLKRLLAYSTVAQIGYILFGVSIFTAASVIGSLFHVANHLIMKSLLFLSAGSFLHQTGTRDIHELSGVRKVMPLTSACFTIGIFAIAAVPGLNGFWSELMIVMAGVQSGMILLSGLMVLNIFLSVAYYLRLIYNMILKEPGEKLDGVKDASYVMMLPLIVLALACIFIGIYPDPAIQLASRATEALLNVTSYIDAVM